MHEDEDEKDICNYEVDNNHDNDNINAYDDHGDECDNNANANKDDDTSNTNNVAAFTLAGDDICDNDAGDTTKNCGGDDVETRAFDIVTDSATTLYAYADC
jgi:hypothetical protein